MIKSLEVRQWEKYCSILGVNPSSEKVKGSVYYKEGFHTWKVLQSEYKYYSHMNYTK